MTWDYKRDFKSLANAVKMQGTFLSDKSLSQYLLKVIQPGILRRNNLKILEKDVKNGCECSSIAVILDVRKTPRFNQCTKSGYAITNENKKKYG